MNRDDLLEAINDQKIMTNGSGAANALSELVKLHQQMDDNSCSYCETWYPCKTIKVIEAEIM